MCFERIANAWRIRICGRDKSVPYGCLWFAITLRTDCQNVANTNEIHTKHLRNGVRTLRKHPRNIPLGVGADSSCPYPDIIKYIYSFHHKRAFAPHFVGVFIFAGTINRSPTAACGLPLRCERIAKMLRTDC